MSPRPPTAEMDPSTLPTADTTSSGRNASITSFTSSHNSPHSHTPIPQPPQGLAPTRPKMTSRKSSGTIIVPREHPKVELGLGDEVFDEDDARAMSPRRSSQDLEKMSRDARELLNEHAKALQLSLLEIFNRIEAVKEEHDKLDNNNKFLQKYIGDLMSTSKITSTGSSGAGGSGSGQGGGGGRKK